jgi:hypothetical protein
VQKPAGSRKATKTGLLDAGFSMLDARCSMLDGGRSITLSYQPSARGERQNDDQQRTTND